MTDDRTYDQTLYDPAEAMEGNPGADVGDEDEFTDEAMAGLAACSGTIDVRDARDLEFYGERIADIGRASHSAFGDRIVIVAGRLQDLAREARRRLVADQQPMTDGGAETFG
jgi:hypothetical protein